jgi:hypothetical protein
MSFSYTMYKMEMKPLQVKRPKTRHDRVLPAVGRSYSSRPRKWRKWNRNKSKSLSPNSKKKKKKKVALRDIQEDSTLYGHCREKLGSYKLS